jgi:hypothetical protein
VANEHRRSIAKREAGEGGDGGLAGGSAREILVRDPRQPPDRRRERTLGIGERKKALPEFDRAVPREADAHRTDLDDPLALGLVAGRLEVDRDELAFQPFADLAAEQAVGRRAVCAPRKSTPRSLAPAVQASGDVRGQDARPVFFWLGVLALTVLLAGLALGSVTLPGELPALAPATPRRSATPPPRPSGVLLSDTRGLIALDETSSPAKLRRETDATAVATLRGQGFIGAVSGTGRRVAYWVTSNGGTRELRVFDVTAPDQDTSLATILEAERGAGAVWSTDRTGLLVAVESSGRAGSGEAPGQFSALRVVDTPTRSIQEIARLSDGTVFWPVGWDRDARLTGACVASADGTAIAYAVVGEDALSARVPMGAGIMAGTVQSSANAVLGVVNGRVIRVWSIASYNEHRELGAPAGERIAFARWKPGGTEIVVSIADRLEVWPAGGGDHRIVARGLSAASDLLVSADGMLAFVGFDSGRSAVAVDLATGRSTPVPMAGERLLAAVSFR